MHTWADKHPCTACGMGYGRCSPLALASRKCCASCAHPSRWAADPWTAQDLRDMWEGKEMPPQIKQRLAELDATARRDLPEHTF